MVSSNFTESDGSRSESVWLLDTSSSVKLGLKGQKSNSSDVRSILFLAAFLLAAWDLRGALPPVDLRAVCFVRAMYVVGVISCF